MISNRNNALALQNPSENISETLIPTHICSWVSHVTGNVVEFWERKVSFMVKTKEPPLST